MAEIIRMPRLSDTMEEGNIVSWLKKVGDKVSPGDILAEVETDKATMELESFFSGTLLYIGQESGNVPVDGIIAVIGEPNEDYKSLIAEQENTKGSDAKADENESQSEQNKSSVKEEPKAENNVAQKQEEIKAKENTSESDTNRIKASPLAKSIANEAGIDLNMVEGSGDGGRIVKKDVENFKANPSAGKAASSVSISPVLSDNVQYGDVPVSQMRKTIARRLAESKFTAPHFYLTMEINMDEAIKARNAINENSDVRISFNDFVVKASALALRKHPAVNSSWFGDKITVHKEINIGVAVAVPDGLLVPVVNHADLKSLSMINEEVKALAGKAKEKKLTPQEMQGNTFTISNLGMFDIDEFTAIINPPDACILAVGSISKKPTVKNDQLVVGNVMKVTLSCDHRVVDGATGAQFLQALKFLLENPVRMLI
jgi:pyruvate dehydrogenase E2 component (dihydrolipoamide acetyltransferase)